MKFIFKNNNPQPQEKEIPLIWEKNEPKIIKNIYQITGLKLKTNKIICTIDNSTSHGLYGYKNITLGIKGGITKDDILMVITHELFHIFYWGKIRKIKLSKGFLGKETKKEWELAEITAFFITSEPKLKKFWPNAKVYLYPETKELYKKVKRFWKKKDFEYFLKNSYKQVK
ncbi:MAG: hypothetical protein V1889_02270 [archaeon]